ncbi:hypothetical protein BKA70DRAFT_690522 [Coprinopsis sp. MPI-PUGE-AT-0042]|nr:hypothetical protein BKA70DRAFT_690522 [Coprinopsis sp. MPI-PUGE-AT-0042]
MLRPSGLALPCIPIRLLQVLLLMVRRRTDVLSLSSNHIRKGATAISESASLWVNSCRRILFVAGISARCPTTGQAKSFRWTRPFAGLASRVLSKGFAIPSGHLHRCLASMALDGDKAAIGVLPKGIDGSGH